MMYWAVIATVSAFILAVCLVVTKRSLADASDRVNHLAMLNRTMMTKSISMGHSTTATVRTIHHFDGSNIHPEVAQDQVAGDQW